MASARANPPELSPTKCPRQDQREDDTGGDQGDAGIDKEHAKTDVRRGRWRGEVVGGVGDSEEEDRDRGRPQQLSSLSLRAAVAVDGL